MVFCQVMPHSILKNDEGCLITPMRSLHSDKYVLSFLSLSLFPLDTMRRLEHYFSSFLSLSFLHNEQDISNIIAGPARHQLMAT